MRGIAGLASLTASLGFILLFTNCNSHNTTVNETAFYYYPKANVYYNVAAKAYYYSLNGAKTWQQMTDTAGTTPASLGEKVILNSASDSIWKENANHRQLYAGVLYNVASYKDTGAAVATKAIERKVSYKKNRSTQPQAEQPRKKKGLGKFLQKVFGKKKDK